LLQVFFIFPYFDLDLKNKVPNFIAFHSRIYLIANSFGGRQAVGGSYADFVSLVMQCNEKLRQSAALPAL
jgi:hypothetical protein